MRREKSDRARIHAARRVFELGDKLHGAHLGRTCHRATCGKQSARKNIVKTNFVGAAARALTVEVICQSVGYRSTEKSSSTFDASQCARRGPVSLRTRSTIMTFSLRFFGSPRSHSEMSRSSRVVRPRGAVPFMGRVVIRRSPPREPQFFDAKEQLPGEKRENVAPLLPVQKRAVVDRLA